MKKNVKLTSRQIEIYGYILSFYQDNSFYPTIREIADELMLSRSTVHRHLEVMEEKGHLIRYPMKTRAMKLVGDAV